MPVIEASQLTMTYRVPLREGGLRAAARALLQPRFRAVHALRGVSFTLDAGEIVGFIGPNGAGKTTTLKILSGILHPTAGTARVLGYEPERRETGFLRQIAMIRGSKPLGVPAELTVLDALRFQRLIYNVPEAAFARNLDELSALLDLAPLLPRQVRALSLGERARAGLASALVYRPRVLFLDEPTLGLDVTMIGMVRRFIAEYCRQTRATVLLTSHYMADVENLCARIILVDGGAVRFDGRLADITARLAPDKLLRVAVSEGAEVDWSRFGIVVERGDGRVSLRIPRPEVPAATARILAELAVVDLSVEDPPLESVIDQFYREGSACTVS